MFVFVTVVENSQRLLSGKCMSSDAVERLVLTCVAFAAGYLCVHVAESLYYAVDSVSTGCGYGGEVSAYLGALEWSKGEQGR
jgi:hypothetical protein